MTYNDRIVCFIDLMGFTARVNATITSDGSPDEKRINELGKALQTIRDILDIDRPDERPYAEITQFSDSVVISFPAETESGVFNALLRILWVQMGLISCGILCRGGIVRGHLIHTGTMLFGPAYMEAYFLESKAALYPRVILGEEIIEAGCVAHAQHHCLEDEFKSIMSLVKKDADGMYYIDYVTGAQTELNDPECDYPGYLYRLQEKIAEISNSADPSLIVKAGWLREKFIPHLLEIKNAVREKMNPEDDLRKAYESISDL